jgi:hypothetical protein
MKPPTQIKARKRSNAVVIKSAPPVKSNGRAGANIATVFLDNDLQVRRFTLQTRAKSSLFQVRQPSKNLGSKKGRRS